MLNGSERLIHFRPVDRVEVDLKVIEQCLLQVYECSQSPILLKTFVELLEVEEHPNVVTVFIIRVRGGRALTSR
jgi:hypothetical protein